MALGATWLIWTDWFTWELCLFSYWTCAGKDLLILCPENDMFKSLLILAGGRGGGGLFIVIGPVDMKILPTLEFLIAGWLLIEIFALEALRLLTLVFTVV